MSDVKTYITFKTIPEFNCSIYNPDWHNLVILKSDHEAKIESLEQELKQERFIKESFVKATLTSSEENEKLEQENGKLKAQLTHRHIIGKSYEVSAESINRLAGECEELKAEIERLNQKYDFQLLVKSNEELKRQVEEAVHCLAVVKRDYNKKDQGGEMEDLVEQTLRAITKPQTEDKV